MHGKNNLVERARSPITTKPPSPGHRSTPRPLEVCARLAQPTAYGRTPNPSPPHDPSPPTTSRRPTIFTNRFDSIKARVSPLLTQPLGPNTGVHLIATRATARENGKARRQEPRTDRNRVRAPSHQAIPAIPANPAPTSQPLQCNPGSPLHMAVLASSLTKARRREKFPSTAPRNTNAGASQHRTHSPISLAPEHYQDVAINAGMTKADRLANG